MNRKRAGQGKLLTQLSKSFDGCFQQMTSAMRESTERSGSTILRPLTFARSYATIADRKRQNSRGTCHRNKTNERKHCAAGNTEPIPKRFSGDGSAPPRFLVAVNFAFRRLAKATRPLCSATFLAAPRKSAALGHGFCTD